MGTFWKYINRAGELFISRDERSNSDLGPLYIMPLYLYCLLIVVLSGSIFC